MRSRPPNTTTMSRQPPRCHEPGSHLRHSPPAVQMPTCPDISTVCVGEPGEPPRPGSHQQPRKAIDPQSLGPWTFLESGRSLSPHDTFISVSCNIIRYNPQKPLPPQRTTMMLDNHPLRTPTALTDTPAHHQHRRGRSVVNPASNRPTVGSVADMNTPGPTTAGLTTHHTYGPTQPTLVNNTPGSQDCALAFTWHPSGPEVLRPAVYNCGWLAGNPSPQGPGCHLFGSTAVIHTCDPAVPKFHSLMAQP